MRYIVLNSSHFFKFTRMYPFWYYLYDTERIIKRLNNTGYTDVYYVLRPKLKYLSLSPEEDSAMECSFSEMCPFSLSELFE